MPEQSHYSQIADAARAYARAFDEFGELPDQQYLDALIDAVDSLQGQNEGAEEQSKEYPELPMRITGIKVLPDMSLFRNGRTKCGDAVAVRPCDEEFEGKTYLGVYLGDFPMDPVAMIHGTEVIVMSMTNPLIFIPDKAVCVRGAGSWWGKIDRPEDLKPITQTDIENIWYIKALKNLSEETKANKEEE